MGVFEGLKPEAVWGYFEEICQVRLFIGLGEETQSGGETG